jgi:hypothetical protein
VLNTVLERRAAVQKNLLRLLDCAFAALHRYCTSCCARDLLDKLLDTELVTVVDITLDIVFVAVPGTVLYIVIFAVFVSLLCTILYSACYFFLLHYYGLR